MSSQYRSAVDITGSYIKPVNEVTWWENLRIDALAIAKDLWKQTHTKHGRVDPQTQSMTIDASETTAKN
jgi:hypothetical protein